MLAHLPEIAFWGTLLAFAVAGAILSCLNLGEPDDRL